MNMEQRIEALEEELDILKNQIQATLLDVREMLLTHTYQALRADDVPPPHTSDAGPVRSEAPAALHTIRIDEEGEAQHVRDQEPVDWEMLQELEEWTTRKLEQIGPERTRDLIMLYGEKGRFDPNVTDVLLEFVSLYCVDHPETQGRAEPRRRQARTETRREARPQERRQRPPQYDDEPYADPHSAPTQMRRPPDWQEEQAPVEPPRRKRQRPHPTQEPQPTPPPQYSAENAAPLKRVKIEDEGPLKQMHVESERPPRRQRRDATVHDVNADEVVSDDKQSTILRLIAGVSNASIGMSRKRDNG